MQVELTDEERKFLIQQVSAQALTYMGHYVRGELNEKESAQMRWLLALGEKLDAKEGARRE